MIKQLTRVASLVTLLSFPNINFAQAINLNSAANFVLFSTDGPLSNTGTSSLTGNVGSNNGASTNFTPLNGVVHDMDGTSALAATDLLSAYNQLNSKTATLIPVTTLGNGQTLVPGTYSLTAATTINDTLNLDAQSNSNAQFIIQVQGALSSAPNAVVRLINGGLACNVYWQIEGVVSLSAGTKMVGTIIANNAAINLYAGTVLNGRALSTNGAIGVFGVTLSIPTGCATLAINPPAISLHPSNQLGCPGATIKFSVSAYGSSITYQWRKGTLNLVNGGNISGATSSKLVITNATALDVASDYNVVVSGAAAPAVGSNHASLTLASLPAITGQPINAVQCIDYPTYFSVTASGSNLTYQWRKGAVNMVNGGNISGANSTKLNFALMSASDVASDYNVVVSGSCLPSVTSGDVSLSVCGPVGIKNYDVSDKTLSIYPNPFKGSVNIVMHDHSQINNSEVRIYDISGAEVLRIPVTKQLTTVETSKLTPGVYFFNLNSNGKTIQAGKLIAE